MAPVPERRRPAEAILNTVPNRTSAGPLGEDGRFGAESGCDILRQGVWSPHDQNNLDDSPRLVGKVLEAAPTTTAADAC